MNFILKFDEFKNNLYLKENRDLRLFEASIGDNEIEDEINTYNRMKEKNKNTVLIYSLVSLCSMVLVGIFLLKKMKDTNNSIKKDLDDIRSSIKRDKNYTDEEKNTVNNIVNVAEDILNGTKKDIEQTVSTIIKEEISKIDASQYMDIKEKTEKKKIVINTWQDILDNSIEVSKTLHYPYSGKEAFNNTEVFNFFVTKIKKNFDITNDEIFQRLKSRFFAALKSKQKTKKDVYEWLNSIWQNKIEFYMPLTFEGTLDEWIELYNKLIYEIAKKALENIESDIEYLKNNVVDDKVTEKIAKDAKVITNDVKKIINTRKTEGNIDVVSNEAKKITKSIKKLDNTVVTKNLDKENVARKSKTKEPTEEDIRNANTELSGTISTEKGTTEKPKGPTLPQIKSRIERLVSVAVGAKVLTREQRKDLLELTNLYLEKKKKDQLSEDDLNRYDFNNILSRAAFLSLIDVKPKKGETPEEVPLDKEMQAERQKVVDALFNAHKELNTNTQMSNLSILKKLHRNLTGVYNKFMQNVGYEPMPNWITKFDIKKITDVNRAIKQLPEKMVKI